MAKVCKNCSTCAYLHVADGLTLYYLYKIFLSWNIGLFQKKCPDCGHSMNSHSKRADGS